MTSRDHGFTSFHFQWIFQHPQSCCSVSERNTMNGNAIRMWELAQRAVESFGSGGRARPRPEPLDCNALPRLCTPQSMAVSTGWWPLAEFYGCEQHSGPHFLFHPHFNVLTH